MTPADVKQRINENKLGATVAVPERFFDEFIQKFKEDQQPRALGEFQGGFRAATFAKGNSVASSYVAAEEPVVDFPRASFTARPSITPLAAPTNPPLPPATLTSDHYKINKGDSLSKIARELHLGSDGVEQLMSANPSLKDPNKIKAGASLNLPPNGFIRGAEQTNGKATDDHSKPKASTTIQ